MSIWSGKETKAAKQSYGPLILHLPVSALLRVVSSGFFSTAWTISSIEVGFEPWSPYVVYGPWTIARYMAIVQTCVEQTKQQTNKPRGNNVVIPYDVQRTTARKRDKSSKWVSGVLIWCGSVQSEMLDGKYCSAAGTLPGAGTGTGTGTIPNNHRVIYWVIFESMAKRSQTSQLTYPGMPTNWRRTVWWRTGGGKHSFAPKSILVCFLV